MSGILDQLSASIDSQVQALPGKSAISVKEKLAKEGERLQEAEKNKQNPPANPNPDSKKTEPPKPDEKNKTLEQRAQEKIEEILNKGNPEPEKPSNPENKSPENHEPVKPDKSEEETPELLFFKSQEKPSTELPGIDSGLEYISKNLNIKFEKPEDIQSFVTGYNNLLQEREKLSQDYEKAKWFENLVNSIPDDLYGAIDQWINEKDYRSFLSEQLSQKIDFSKPYHKHSTKDLMQFYYPGKFTDDELSDNENKAVQVLLETIEAKYEQDQSKYRNKEKSYRENEKKALAEFTEQLAKSQKTAENYFNSLPTSFKDDHKSKLKKLMEQGQQGVLLEFFKPDGTWKENSMELLAYLKYGKDQLEIAKKLIQREVQSKVNEEIVQRGADKPTPDGGSGRPSDIDYGKVTEFVKKVVPQKRK